MWAYSGAATQIDARMYNGVYVFNISKEDNILVKDPITLNNQYNIGTSTASSDYYSFGFKLIPDTPFFSPNYSDEPLDISKFTITITYNTAQYWDGGLWFNGQSIIQISYNNGTLNFDNSTYPQKYDKWTSSSYTIGIRYLTRNISFTKS